MIPVPKMFAAKAAEAVISGWNQYPPMMGLPELRRGGRGALRALAGSSRSIPKSEIMVTSGATEALTGALLTLIEPGDEVVLFQPLYDAYLPLVKRAGGIPKFVRLEPPHWRFTAESLRRPSRSAPSWFCSTIRSIPPGRSIRRTISRCSPASASS
jgi:N-succinyldiaminopimelate aminotransferase